MRQKPLKIVILTEKWLMGQPSGRLAFPAEEKSPILQNLVHPVHPVKKKLPIPDASERRPYPKKIRVHPRNL